MPSTEEVTGVICEQFHCHDEKNKQKPEQGARRELEEEGV